MKRWTRLTAAAAALSMVLLGVAACSGNSSDDSADNGLEVLRVGTVGNTFNMGLTVNIRTTDAARNAGFDVEMSYFNSNIANAIAALLHGSIDVATIGVGGALDPMVQGTDLRIIAVTSTTQGDIVVNTATADKLKAEYGVTPDSPLKDRIVALKGLTFGTAPAPSGTYTIGALLLQAGGLSPDDVNIVNTADDASTIASLVNGQTDASIKAGGVFAGAINDGKAVLWASASEIEPSDTTPGVSTAPYNVAVVLDERAKDKDWLDRISQMFSESHQLALDDEDAFLAKVNVDPNFQALKPEVVKLTWENEQKYMTDGKLAEADWKAVRDLQTLVTGKDYSSLDFDTFVLPQARE